MSYLITIPAMKNMIWKAAVVIRRAQWAMKSCDVHKAVKAGAGIYLLGDCELCA